MNKFNYRFLLIIILGLLTSHTLGKTPVSLEDKVDFLVEKIMKSKQKERSAFQELELLGDQAAPYIISHLGDMRLLPEQAITLENKSPDHFEAMRHYKPQVVHDALAAILSQITGQHFIFVYNGATLDERTENIEHWVTWCQSTYPEKIQVCGKAKK